MTLSHRCRARAIPVYHRQVNRAGLAIHRIARMRE